MIYGRDANRQVAQEAALKGVQSRFEALRVETKLETAPETSGATRLSHCKGLEAWPRIELGCTDLQSAT